MDRIIGGFLLGFVLFLYVGMGITWYNEHSVDPEATPATTEQMLVLHYIKNNTGHIGNEVNLEFYDGELTKKDYNEVIKRVQQQINRDGFNKFFGPVRME